MYLCIPISTIMRPIYVFTPIKTLINSQQEHPLSVRAPCRSASFGLAQHLDWDIEPYREKPTNQLARAKSP